MSAFTHRGYAARIEFDPDDEIFVGHVAGIADPVGFHAGTVDGLKAAFVEAVDDYLDACAKAGREPLRAFSGRLMLRIGARPRR